jgi:uncharacterized protein
MRFASLLLVLLFIPRLSAATISVEGTATVLVAPEQAILTIGIETDAEALEQAQARNDQLGRAVVEKLKALSPVVQIQTGVMSLGPDRDNKRAIIKYVAHQVLTITGEPAQVRQVVAAALQAGATDIFDVEYAVKDARKYRDQARLLACKAAREKAELLANALGAKVGAVNAINESNNWYWVGRWRSAWWCWSGYWPIHWGGGGYGYQSQNVIVSAGGGAEASPGETQSLSAQINVSFMLE